MINTHFHLDHAGGNAAFAKAGALIIAHKSAVKHMKNDWSHWAFNYKIPPYPKIALPVITFTESITLHHNGDEIQTFHVKNTHSGSDSIVYFRNANVVHMGDLYFAGDYPFIDTPHGGSINGYISALDLVIEKINENTKVIPGHGPLSNREQLQAYRYMLRTIRDRILQYIEEGKTMEEVLALKPTADFYRDMRLQMPTDLFVQIVYKDLKSKLPALDPIINIICQRFIF